MQDIPNHRLIIVCGPTGAGKTGFAIDLARQFDAEIVGADSMQIYRKMDIGTAKPTAAEKAAVPHHLIDVVDPDEPFDAARYAEMAAACVHAVITRGRNVFVVGGTGLYIKALVYGLFEEGPSDANLRRRLNRQAKAQGSERLHRRLQKVDPATAERIHPNDTYRIVRALEVHTLTGEPMSLFLRRHAFRRPRFDALEIGLSWPRPVLYDRINRRVDSMMAEGFLDEVRRLLADGYARELKSMQSLGYRHLTAVIDGSLKLADAVSILKRDHRRYAKRQLTWFKARPAVRWLTPQQMDTAAGWIRDFLAGGHPLQPEGGLYDDAAAESTP